MPPPHLPIPVCGGTELKLLWSTPPVHAATSHDPFPLTGVRLAALMGIDLFIPESGLQASEGNPPQGRGGRRVFHPARSSSCFVCMVLFLFSLFSI